MAEATSEFFQQLSERGRDPLLEKARGTVRLELVEGRRVVPVVVKIDRGEVDVSAADAPADLTLRAERTVFDGIARGKLNAVTAVLRGALTLEGNLGLAVLLLRVFPGPQAKPKPKPKRRTTARKPARKAKR